MQHNGVSVQLADKQHTGNYKVGWIEELKNPDLKCPAKKKERTQRCVCVCVCVCVDVDVVWCVVCKEYNIMTI